MTEIHDGRRLTLSFEHRDRWSLLTATASALPLLALFLARTGIPPLPGMGPLHRVGVVGPTCGLTRAGVALAGGDAVAALRYNPAIFLVAGGVAALLTRAGAGLLTHRWVHGSFRVSWWWAALGVASVLALWVRQQSEAGLLIP